MIVCENAKAIRRALGMPVGHAGHSCDRSNTATSLFQLNNGPHDTPPFAFFLCITAEVAFLVCLLSLRESLRLRRKFRSAMA